MKADWWATSLDKHSVVHFSDKCLEEATMREWARLQNLRGREVCMMRREMDEHSYKNVILNPEPGPAVSRELGERLAKELAQKLDVGAKRHHNHDGDKGSLSWTTCLVCLRAASAGNAGEGHKEIADAILEARAA